MAKQRREPYLWVTWITKLLAGEQNCEWATWFKAHFSDFEKQARSTDLATWTAQHNAMTRKRADELRAEGYRVYVEDQNKFTFRGQAATLQGKPDIVAVSTTHDPGQEDVLVVDCKSGKKRDSDRLQVLIYMMVLPYTHEACKDKIVRGELEYSDDRIRIDVLPASVRELIISTIKRVAGADQLARVPSFSECRFCDLTSVDCSARVNEDESAPVTHGLW